MNVDAVIARVRARLRRNQISTVALLLLIGISYAVFTLLAVWNASTMLASVVSALPLIIAAAFCQRRGLLRGPSQNESCALLDSKLDSKDRFLTFADLGTNPSDTLAEAKRELIQKQVAASIATINVNRLAPLRLNDALRRTLYSIPVVWALIIALLLRYDFPGLTSPRSAEARSIEKLIEANPTLPQPLKNELHALAESVEQHALTSEEVKAALQNAEKALEDSKAELEKEGESGVGEADENSVTPPAEGQAVETPTPEPATPTPVVEQKQSDQSQTPEEQKKQEQSKEEQQKQQQQQQKDQGQKEEKTPENVDNQHTKQSSGGKSGQDQSKENNSSGQQGQSGQQSQSQGQNGEGEGKDSSQSGSQSGKGQGKEAKGQSGSQDAQTSADQKQQGKADGKQDVGKQDGSGDKQEGKGAQEQSGQGKEGSQENKPQSQGDQEKKQQELDQAGKALSELKGKIEEQKQSQQEGTQGDSGEKPGDKKQNAPQGKSGSASEQNQGQKDQSDKGQGEKKGGKEGQKKPDSEASKAGAPSKGQKSGDDMEPSEELNAKESSLGKEGEAAKRFSEGDGKEGGGLGDKKEFKDTQIPGDKEKFDARYTGKEGNLGKNNSLAKFKTSIEDVKLGRPEPLKDQSSQPVPLEYKDVLE